MRKSGVTSQRSVYLTVSLKTIITIIASSGWRTSGSLSVLSVREGLMLVLVIVQVQTHLPFIPPLVSEPALPLARVAFPPACSPPPPPFLERKSATAIYTPGLWITLNLKGCKARYQWVIRALVSFMRWSHWRGAWSEQRVNSRPRR